MIPDRSIIVRCIFFCVLLLCSGCVVKKQTREEGLQPEVQAEKVVAPAPPEEEQYYTHKIQWQGENLVRISRWYTGSENNWERIIKVNPAIEPKKIKIGDSILIPIDLMKTFEPMPKGYRVPAARSKTNDIKALPVNVTPELPADSPPDSVEGELFGPIDSGSSTPSPGRSVPPLSLETIE